MARFQDALEDVLRYRSDRSIVLGLSTAGREVRYEALRRGIGNESPQLFRDSVERLSTHALINRRLVPSGRRYSSYLSTTEAGDKVASVLVSFREGRPIPTELRPSERKVLEAIFAVPVLS
jgi:DNA-binding HxlR family transcriptional regulator